MLAKRKNILFLSLFSVFLFCLILSVRPYVFADNSPVSGSPSLEDQVKSKIAEKQLQAKTLQQEISDMQKQIDTVSEKLKQIDADVVSISIQRDSLLNDIALNEKRLEIEKAKLKEGVKTLYALGDTNPIYILASGKTISSVLSQEQYVNAVNSDVSHSVNRIKEIKEELDKKKKDIDDQEEQLQSLKEQQQMISENLSGQIMAKNRLLQDTKGDEAKYQELLAGGLIDKDDVFAIMKSISSGASPTAIGLPYSGPRVGQRVYRGEVIARMGNTGFSSGPHTHFGVYQNGQDVDPMPLLSSGTFVVPAPGAQITQTFEGTYSHRGRGPGWPGGIDFAAVEGTPIRAAREGIILFDGVGKGGLDKGFGHYMILDHQNGYLTLYGHLK